MTNNENAQSPVKQPVVLSEEEIHERLNKDLFIEPLIDEDTQISGCKVDLRLGGIFYEIQQSSLQVYDPLNPPLADYRRKIIVPLGREYILHPGMLALTPTFESIILPNDLLGVLQGRSSLGRLGIIVHATAGFVDPGYRGPITLELSNLGHLPVALYSLTRVAAIAFIKVTGKAKLYHEKLTSPVHPDKEIELGHFNSPTSEPSKLGEDWEMEVLKRIQELAMGKN
jgi:dCTP deaminase